MKKSLVLIAVSSLTINTTISSVPSFSNDRKSQISNNIPTDLANQYAQETSIMPKSLLISKAHALNTTPLLSNLNSKLTNRVTNFNLPTQAGANGFIDSLTTNLDLESINNIQSNFQSNGKNQTAIDRATNKLSQFNTYKTISSGALQYFNNSFLSSDGVSDILDQLLKSAKTNLPDITTYLSYIKYEKVLSLVSNELLNDWDQEKDWGDSPLEAMKNYIHSDKGDIAEGKNTGSKGEWHYIAARATNWTWNNFYQYIAGVNLNYTIKLLSGGKYIGDMINDNLHLSGFPWNWYFDNDNFLNTLSAAINKIMDTPNAWPYLVKCLVPIVKEKILKFDNPTLGVRDLTWDDKTSSESNKTVELKSVLLEIEHLLSTDGRNDLISLISSLLTGTFGEDVIIDAGSILGHYTLPELFSTVGIDWFVKPESIAQGIATALTNITDPLNISKIVNEITTFADKYLTFNPIFDLKDLSYYLNNIFNSDSFNQALNEITDIINNPNTSKYNAKEILELLGVQKEATDFKANSPLFYLEQWLAQSNSTINQLLNIITNKGNTGVLDNMIKEQSDFLDNNYYKYFDINNAKDFKISDVVANKQENNNRTEITLSYNLTDLVNNKTYTLSFFNKDTTNKIFLLSSFHTLSI